MSILIKGMEMPKHCGECGIEWCTRWKKLIDADLLSAKCDDPNWCVWLSDIDDAPTVIPADNGGAE